MSDELRVISDPQVLGGEPSILGVSASAALAAYNEDRAARVRGTDPGGRLASLFASAGVKMDAWMSVEIALEEWDEQGRPATGAVVLRSLRVGELRAWLARFPDDAPVEGGWMYARSTGAHGIAVGDQGVPNMISEAEAAELVEKGQEED